jgi:hypothetical protein
MATDPLAPPTAFELLDFETLGQKNTPLYDSLLREYGKLAEAHNGGRDAMYEVGKTISEEQNEKNVDEYLLLCIAKNKSASNLVQYLNFSCDPHPDHVPMDETPTWFDLAVTCTAKHLPVTWKEGVPDSKKRELLADFIPKHLAERKICVEKVMPHAEFLDRQWLIDSAHKDSGLGR